MPDFSRDDRMPPINQGSLPPASHTTAPRERRYSGPSDSGGKPARYPAVYQRPPPADYYRGPSPPPQPYRWSPAPPLDEPAYPPRAPHGAYHRDSWDYQYRDSHIVPSRPSFPPSRTPPPFQEWGHMNSERGWSPGFGPEDSRYPRRSDWEDRENSQHYQHGWDRPPSPGPPPPRDWQHGPYDRPPAGQPRGSSSVLHEPGWREPPVSHYDRDLREDWIPPPPDDWSRDRDDHFIPDDPYLNDPPPPGPSYGPPRARGRSFVQDRRMPQPSPSYSHPPPAQSPPRGPSHMPLDTPNRRHSQHDRRYSGGPGYSGEGRGYIPHGPRRQYQSGRSSFNDSSHLPSRGAKIVPRDQLLVANTSIKVEDTTDGQPLSASTPAPASASSASPDKSSFAGKRSRTDSVAAEAEPASRRPSPFASSAATVATTAADSAPTTQPASTEARPPVTAATEKPKQTATEPPVSVPAESEGKQPDEPQEQRVYADPNGASEPVSATGEPPAVSAQPDIPLAPAKEVPAEETPVALPDDAPKPADEIPMDVEPSASQNGPVQPLSDVITADSAVDAATDAPDANVPDDRSESSASPEPDVETPYEHFEYFDFSEIDNGGENVPFTSARDAIPHRDTDFKKLEEEVEVILEDNIDVSENQNRRPKLPGMTFLEIELPNEDEQATLRTMFAKNFEERENNIEAKVGALEEEYLTLHQDWVSYCAQLDQAAEVRRVKDAKAAAAAALNVVSEPVAAQTRSTRRNPVVNTGVMADAVHSDMEMEKVMNNMRDAAAVDPDLLARPNLAKIPDMVTVTEPEHLRLTFDDENGQVDSPLEFYDFRGRAVEHWTTEERSIFIEQHRIFNKRFEKIAEHLPFKTTSQCVQYYYLMKKVPAFRAQVKRGQRRRLGRGGHQGKASALMADIEKEEDGTTASPREDDSIATRRSRRHAALAAATPPPSAGTSEVTKPRRSRVVELARGDSFSAERDGTVTPASVASDSEGGGESINLADLGVLLSNQSTRRGGPGRGRRWAGKGETPNGNGGSVRLDGAEPPKKRPATTSYWTVAERTKLKQHLLHHGRDWNRIASMIQTKTAIQAKNYYFNNQKEMSVFVKAWEREQGRGNESEGSPPNIRFVASPATYSSGSTAKDTKKAGTPVTIQPAPGQSSASASTGGASTPNKGNTGRGSSHYPNVIPHSQQPAPAPQQPQWAKNTFPVTKTKTQPNQPQAIPTPPLPLPGPTFRAWPVPPVSGPAAAPSVGYSYQTFSGVASPNATKGNGAQPIVQRTGSASASASATPSPNANPTSNVGRATSGVQRTSVNHYPGPMRYQPYPIAGGAKQAKQMLPQQPGAGYRTARPIPGAVTSTSPLPKLPLPRNSSGQFASWTGDKGKKPA